MTNQVDDVDMVARRIIMHRATWDECMRIAEATAATQGAPCTGIDVAVLALEKGLEIVRKAEKLPKKKATRRKRAAQSLG